jgi:hypothetical protein
MSLRLLLGATGAAFAPRSSTEETFVLQLAGKQAWTYSLDASSCRRELEAGALLFLPRGFSLGCQFLSPSVSLLIGVRAPTVAEAFTRAMEAELLSKDPFWSAPLPYDGAERLREADQRFSADRRSDSKGRSREHQLNDLRFSFTPGVRIERESSDGLEIDCAGRTFRVKLGASARELVRWATLRHDGFKKADWADEAHVLGLAEPSATGILAILEHEGLIRRVHEDLEIRFDYAPDHLEVDLRSDDVFIVTFPRSGTTWLQKIITEILHPDARYSHIYEISPYYESETAMIGADRINSMAGRRVFKTHLTFEQMPELPRGCKVVYMLRDPADVAISLFHHYREVEGSTASFDTYLEQYLGDRLGDPSWFEHARSWWPHRENSDVLFLHYEESLVAPASAIERIARFLDVSLKEKEVARVARRSSFEAMKRDEARFAFQTGLLWMKSLQPRSFIRAGKAGSGERELGPRELERIRARVIEELPGYALERPIARRKRAG